MTSSLASYSLLTKRPTMITERAKMILHSAWPSRPGAVDEVALDLLPDLGEHTANVLPFANLGGPDVPCQLHWSVSKR
jgi:hypothetical protein